jgi:hypothetical protein
MFLAADNALKGDVEAAKTALAEAGRLSPMGRPRLSENSYNQIAAWGDERLLIKAVVHGRPRACRTRRAPVWSEVQIQTASRK